MDNFWATFDSWDIEQILLALKRFGITPSDSDPTVQTLSDVPSPIVLRIMSSWSVFSDPQIQTIIHSIPPHKLFRVWPTTIIPPGILVLLIEQTSAMRQWANSQASRYPSVPLTVDKFTGGYMRALETLVFGLTSRDSSATSSGQFSFFHFASGAFESWAGFSTALRFIPVEYLRPSSRCKIDVRKVVSGHLSDNDIRAFFVSSVRIHALN